MTPEIKAYIDQQIREHQHDGLQASQVNLLHLLGKIEVVSAAPAGKPTSIFGQFKIYTNGATLRFYWYDTTAGAWHYVTATA